MATGNYQERITAAQKNEITEHILYRKLARATKDAHNREVLLGISRDELSHYRIWKGYTKRDEKPRLFMLWAYYLVSRVLGSAAKIRPRRTTGTWPGTCRRRSKSPARKTATRLRWCA